MANNGFQGFSLPDTARSSVAAQLGADITLTSAATDYDIVSVALGSGTWLISGKVTLDPLNASGANFALKLWDGTTCYDAAGGGNAQNRQVCLPVAAKITLAAPATIKLTVQADTTGNAAKATPAYVATGAGNTASSLIATPITA